MRLPTDEEINELACEKLLGWRWCVVPRCLFDGSIVLHRGLFSPARIEITQHFESVEFASGEEPRLTGIMQEQPDFCRDANTLPFLLAALKAKHAFLMFLEDLSVFYAPDSENYQPEWNFALTTPRQKTIATLKACSAWPEDWTTGE